MKKPFEPIPNWRSLMLKVARFALAVVFALAFIFGAWGVYYRDELVMVLLSVVGLMALMLCAVLLVYDMKGVD